MRPLLCLAVLLPLTVLAAQKEGAAMPQKLDLFVGGQFVLDFPGVVKVAIGDSAICDVKYLSRDQVLAIGMSEGETTLKVWRRGEAVPTELKVTIGSKPAAATAADPQLTVKVGQESTVTIPGISRVAVGNAELAEVKVVGPDKLVITGGKHVARTTVIVWTKETRTSFLVDVVQ